MTFRKEKIVLDDKVFNFADNYDCIKELLIKSKSPLIDEGYFSLDMVKVIMDTAKTTSLAPEFIAMMFITKTDHLRDIEDVSIEEVHNALGCQGMPNMQFYFNSYGRILSRVIKLNPNQRMVKARDREEPFEVENRATHLLYYLIPWVGDKVHVVYERTTDKEGNITNVEEKVDKYPPFGAYLFRMLSKELGVEDILA